MTQSAYLFQDCKGHALHPTTLPCVGAVASVNVITGCCRKCLFCAARRYHPGTPVVYTDLPRQVADELERAKARGTLPALVLFGTASDPFGEDAFVQELQVQSMEFVLSAGLMVAFRTRGPVGPAFLALFRRFRAQVRPTLVVSALEARALERLEPGAPPVAARLEDLKVLLKAGLDARVRLDPLVPLVSDNEERLDRLFAVLFGLGVQRATGTCPALQPGLLAELGPAFGPSLKGLLAGAYKVGKRVDGELPEPGPRSGWIVSLKERRHVFERATNIAARHRIAFGPCACAHPDLAGLRCFDDKDKQAGATRGQGELL